jgi:hypothetical protein
MPSRRNGAAGRTRASFIALRNLADITEPAYWTFVHWRLFPRRLEEERKRIEALRAPQDEPFP